MARSITISNVAGTTENGNLISIQVSGTVVECDQVDVTIRGGETSEASVHQTAFNISGAWTAIFHDADVRAANCFSQQPITVSAASLSPNDPQCLDAKTFELLSAPPCCNVQITATVSAACDKIRHVTLTLLNNCSSSVSALLDFGKGSPPSAVTIAPGATQSYPSPYAPGTYTAILQIPGCADKLVSFTVLPCTGACCLPDGRCQDGLTKTQCENLGGQYMGDGHLCANTRCPSGNGGDDVCTKTFRKWLCPILLVAMTFSTGIGLALILLASCSGAFASVANYLLTLGTVLCGIGGGALLLYWIFCSKCLCGWFYLFLWRVLFGVGLVITVFAKCCPSLLTAGLILIGIGLLFLILWQKHCNKTLCELLQEVILVMAVYLLPLIALLLGLGTGNLSLSNCLWVLFSWGSFNFTFLALVQIIFGSIVAYELKNC